MHEDEDDEYNPFPVTGYHGPETFCDREEEIKLLRSGIKNGLHTTIFAHRRIGKTGLIHQLFHTTRNHGSMVCIYLDILGTTNLKDLSNYLATAIYNRFPENRSAGKKLLDFLKNLRPIISYDSLTGSPEVTLEPGTQKKPEKTIQQLFQFLDTQKKTIVFAMDEFQQILEYPETNTEAILRACMQGLKNTRFIFCGSNQRRMHEIFNNAKRPFYASCRDMQLGPIPPEKYKSFIQEIFTARKRKISEEAIDFVLDWTLGHTFYVQAFCNQLYSLPRKKITLAEAKETAGLILKQGEHSFYQVRNLLTRNQWTLLTSIARETRLYQAHSVDFIRKSNLGTSSIISRGMDALLEKELVMHQVSTERPYYEVYDKFLMRWLQTKPISLPV